VLREDWLDAKRNRSVPVLIYLPTDARGPMPTVLFSHGLGGSREGYAYLGRYWAEHGYVSVHLQHQGSDETVWRGAAAGEAMRNLRQAAMRLSNFTNRPQDVSFAIDCLERLNASDPRFKGRLDLGKIGVAGHSFGASTTMAVAGQSYRIPGGAAATFADPRVKAVIPMSTPAPFLRNRLDALYAGIRIPSLHMTGTRDDSPIGETKAAERRIPFDHIHGADEYLATFTGGDHMIFSGRGALPGGGQDALFQKDIQQLATAFWDAYLRGDPSAKTWLTGQGARALLGDHGAWEQRLATGR
jgi:predicted dienelactone hydrolase